MEKRMCSEGDLRQLSVTNIFINGREFMDKIGKKQTHAVIAHKAVVDGLIFFNNKMKASEQVLLHRSKHEYFHLPEAMFYRKNLPNDVIQKYEDL